MKKMFFAAAMLAAVSPAGAETTNADSTIVKDIEEVVVVSSPKETTVLRRMPTAVSLFDSHNLADRQVNSLKDLSPYVPNFYMPDYGSSLTSAVYIRGVGSRINTPAVGLYVDNVAYADKTAYDMQFLDVERVDVLRGPQATLYGRNAMGGLIRVFTRNPFRYQGTDIKLGASVKDKGYRASASHYHKVNEHFAFSAGACYENSQGLFHNDFRNEDVGGKEAGGGKLRAIWLPNERLKLDFSADYSYTKDKGYPYAYRGMTNGELTEDELLDSKIGQICYNAPSGYRRQVADGSMQLEYAADNYILSSVSAYQYLNDEMNLDQDFTARDYFTMTQKQKINSWSEELTFKSRSNRKWVWVNGVYALYQTLRTECPVTLTEDFMNKAVLGKANATMDKMGMNMAFDMHGIPFRTDGVFRTPTADVAVFHQSTFNDLFGVEGLSLVAGLRLEYELNTLEYNYGGRIDYDFKISSPMMPLAFNELADETNFNGKTEHGNFQWLPKLALQYHFDTRNNVYVSLSKGFRSGGYNIQMFSDLVQGGLQSAMTQNIKHNMEETFSKPPYSMMPENIRNMILGYIPVSTFEGSPSQTRYKPEYSYNYELGGHFSLFSNRLQLDVAAFYMDIYDQQISRFAGSGLGRVMVNAGRGRSAGAELAMRGALWDNRLAWNASYGYTNSVFKRYEAQAAMGEQEAVNYDGNRVPFVPEHTMAAGIEYTQPFENSFVKAFFIGLNTTGSGSIYWSEDNLYKQNFYALLNAHAGVDFGYVRVDFWGKNLTNTDYDAFFFTSNATTSELKFAQLGNPFQFGVDLSFHF